MVPLGYERVEPGEGRQVLFRVSEDWGSCAPKHWHPALEFIYLLEGEAVIATPRGRSCLKGEDFILINSREIHSSACPSYNRAVLIQVPEELLRSCIPEFDRTWFWLDSTENGAKQYRTKIKQYREEIGGLAKALGRLEKGQKEGWMLAFYSRLFALLEICFREFSEKRGETEIPEKSRQAEILERVFSYTEAHYKEPVRLAEAAKAASLQPQYFCRFFKKSMGMSYVQYLSEYRLSKVCGELFSTRRPIGELLESHGFTNDKLFRRLFWERFGMTPSDMRRAREKA